MIKLITIVSLFVVVTFSSPRIALADGDVHAQGKAESTLVEIRQNNLKELSFDWLLVPQRVEFEGFIHYGSSIQSTSTNVLNQPIFSTRKLTTSGSFFDGQTAVLGGLVREDWQKIQDKADDGGASNLQKLIKERDRLKQRLIEVEALIKKQAKE